MQGLVDMLRIRLVRWSIALGWTILLTVLLLQPEADPLIDLGLPDGDHTLARELVFSTLHLIAFFTTCVAWFWALCNSLGSKASLFLAVVIAIALGCVTEYLQTYTLDRYASWIDLVANFSGTLIAAKLIWRQQSES